MGVIDLDARVKKLEQDTTGGEVIDQLEAAVTALDETVNGNGTTDLGLVGDVSDLETAVGTLQDTRPTVYSETEKVVGTWINGKPIYQKTIIYTVTSDDPQTGKITVPYNVSDIDAVVYLSGIISHTSVVPYGETFPSMDSTMGRVTLKAAGIEINITAGWVDYIFNITLQYTKTTDTPTT